MIRIDRCVCHDVTFETLKAWAEEHDAGLDALGDQFGCGRACGLCVPYVRRMLETGEVVFHEVIEE